MKSWLVKFIGSDESVERALRHPPAVPNADPDLHDSIMCAVRASRRAPRSSHIPRLTWLVASGIGISVAAVCVGLFLRPQAATQTLVAPSDLAQAPGEALDLGAQMPGLFMSPLSSEFNRVDHDIHHTTQVLLASFP